MSLIEGSGILKCHQGHKDEFVTEDKAEFDKHLADGKHTEFGTKPCAICDKPVGNKLHTVGKNAICDECKKELS